MQAFVVGHASHPDAGMALALVAAQIDAQLAARRPAFVATLGMTGIALLLVDEFHRLETSRGCGRTSAPG